MTAASRIDINLILRPHTYAQAQFVNRDQELLTISERVRQLQEKNQVVESIINFWGVRGIGKTWMLRRLRGEYAYRAEAAASPVGVIPTCALLSTPPDELRPTSQNHIVHALAADALAQLGPDLSAEEAENLAQAQDTGQTEALVRALLSLSQSFVPLILLDDAERVSQDDWDRLEQGLIEPLVSTNRVLVVIAGRRRVSRWRRFEVRRRVMEPHKSEVAPFDKKAVTKQLARHDRRIPVDLFFPYTAGNPHLVDAIARHIVSWTGGDQEVDLDQGWFDDRRMPLLQILRASEAYLLDHIPASLLQVLDAVSPLRSYRLEALRCMLTGQEGADERRTDGHYLNILRALDQETEVVWWDRERRAYVTSAVVRRLIGRRQLLDRPEDYANRHRRALEMYQGWVDDYPEASEDFILEIWFHLASLYQQDHNYGRLRDQAKAALHFARSHLSTDRFMILPKQLEQDGELDILLPTDLRHELLQELDQLLNDKTQ
jgi:hypothetical protein